MPFNSFVSSSTVPPTTPKELQSVPSSRTALPEETIDQLAVLFRQEESIYQTTDYLTFRKCQLVVTNDECERQFHHQCNEEESSRSLEKPGVQQECSSNDLLILWRKASCIWAFEVAKFFELNREIVSIAMNHLDRYLATVLSSNGATREKGTTATVPISDIANSTSTIISKQDYQLLVLTSLYLAIKLNHGSGYQDRLELPKSNTHNTLETISLLSDPHPLPIQDLQAMECTLLQTLKWHVHPPTPQTFLRLLWTPAMAESLLGNVDLSLDQSGGYFRQCSQFGHAKVYQRACVVIVEALQEYEYVSFSPSEIAIATILNAVDFCNFGNGHMKETRDDEESPLGKSPSFLLLSLWKEVLPAKFWYKFNSPSFDACRLHLKQYFEPEPKTIMKRRKSSDDGSRQAEDTNDSTAARQESPQASKNGRDDSVRSSLPSTKKARIQVLPSPASARDLFFV